MKLNSCLTYLLLVLVFVSGCTLQKRSYLNGYYLHWKGKPEKATDQRKIKEKKEINEVAKTYIDLPLNSSFENGSCVQNIEAPMVASNDKQFPLTFKKAIKDTIKENCLDSIWLRNGSIISGQIKEITKEKILFKRCGEFTGDYALGKEEVNKIKFALGMEKSFENYLKPGGNGKTTAQISRAALIFSLIGVIALVVAIVNLLLAVTLLDWLAALSISFIIFCFALFFWLCGISLGSVALARIFKRERNPGLETEA